MKINSFEINKSLKLVPVASEEIFEACQKEDARIWIDLQDFTDKELGDVLDKLGVKKLSRRLCLRSRDRAGYYPLKNEIFLVIPVLSEDKGRQQVSFVSFLCRENFLLTVHVNPVLKPKELASLHDSDDWLPERSFAALISAMMIDFSMTCLNRSTDLRESIISLQERMDFRPDTVKAQEILKKRAELLALGTVASDTLPCLQALCVTDKPFFRLEDAQEYLNCALANYQAADGAINWMDQQMSSLRSGFEMNAQNKMNHRLNMLTILSAIFTPITFFAGLWGMNFDVMPELKLTYGYFAALGFMGFIGLGMFLFLLRNGWFKKE